MTEMLGHNNPPSEIEILKEQLSQSYADLENRIADLYEASHKVTDKIKNADTADKVTTLIAQINRALTVSEEARKKEKKPFADKAKEVDSFFSAYKEMLSLAKSISQDKLTDYQVEQKKIADQKAEEERKAREQAAQRELETAVSEVDRIRAQEALSKAKDVKAQDTSVKTNYGNTGYLRETTVVKVGNVNKIPVTFFRKYVPIEVIEKAARAAIKNGETEIPGISIKKEYKSVVK